MDEVLPVKPTMSFSQVIHAAIERRILCPAWRWSKVPPRAVTRYCEGINGSSSSLGVQELVAIS